MSALGYHSKSHSALTEGKLRLKVVKVLPTDTTEKLRTEERSQCCTRCINV